MITQLGLLGYPYFKEHSNLIIAYNLISINITEHQALDADPKAIQQINFTENLTTMFFIFEDPKETILYFSQETVKVL